MMRRSLIMVLLAIGLVLPMASPAGAITNGELDNGAHPYVGLSVYYDANWNPLWRCSGTMISDTVYLTAGHCTDGAVYAQVWFEDEVRATTGYPFTGGYTGVVIPNPNYTGLLPNTGDVGMVILDEAPGLGFASVADVGTLDSMATRRGRQEVWFTAVGYGLQDVKPVEISDRIRMRATVRLVNLRSALTDGYNIHTTAAPGTGGGTCFGDSGGPIFLNDTTVIVAVTSFGLNENCAGADFAYRVDTGEAHEFIFGS